LFFHPHALGQWVDEMLQPIVQAQGAYFKDSFALKKLLNALSLIGHYSLVTCDAVSMYTNIGTDQCITRLSSYLLDPATSKEFPHYPPKALVAALKIVMNNNRMKFGDIFVQQLRGIAMGMSPAPTIANLFVSLHERKEILPKFNSNLHLYRRFIDDGFAVWKHNEDRATDLRNYKAFKKAINSGGLRWTFTDPSLKTDFMDLTVNIVGSKVTTNLYEKPLALHLYIPPHSCHPSSCFGSLVTGMVLRIYRLCTFQKDVSYWLREFYGHLLDRGYQNDAILPLFSKAINITFTFLSASDKYRLQQKTISPPEDKIFFHLKYHPCDPQSHAIQKLWRELVIQPHGEHHISVLRKFNQDRIKATKLILPYSRHSNVGNLLSYRKICKRPGLKVSSFCD